MGLSRRKDRVLLGFKLLKPHLWSVPNWKVEKSLKWVFGFTWKLGWDCSIKETFFRNHLRPIRHFYSVLLLSSSMIKSILKFLLDACSQAGCGTACSQAGCGTACSQAGCGTACSQSGYCTACSQAGCGKACSQAGCGTACSQAGYGTARATAAVRPCRAFTVP